MLFREHLRQIMLTYPTLFPTAIQAYNQLFMVIGNGYEWKDGELVYEDEKSLCSTQEEAINRIIEDRLKLVKEIYEIHHNNETTGNVTFCNIIDRYNYQIKTYIHNIFNIEAIMNDLSIPDVCDPVNEKFYKNKNPKSDDYNKFKFYNLSRYSAIATTPDDVKPDWINAIKEFVSVLTRNRDKFTDSDNLFDCIKERVSNLYEQRFSCVVNIGE